MPAPSRPLATILALAALGASTRCEAASQPLGLVEVVDGQTLTLRFEAAPGLLPGTMLAIYGPGSVEKHPLTKDVIIEQRKLVAKAQLTLADGTRAQARVLWGEPGAAVAAGFDAVPLPGEAAPNAPPALTGAPAKVSAPAGSTAIVSLPVADPDGDAVTYRWTLSGQPGAAGRLDARTTASPQVAWTAPGIPGAASLTVVARDAAGHESTFSVELAATTLEDPRKRDLALFARWGEDAERPLARARRDALGTWIAITEGEGKVVRIAPGWLEWPWLGGSYKDAPAGAVAVASHGRDIYVLDGRAKTVAVHGADGARARTIGSFDRPSDLVVAGDGTVFVADAGGIQVHEADGRFRARIGRAGDGADDFSALARIALGPEGELFALDQKRRRIHRFDRFQRRLPTWEVSGDPSQGPIDLAVHPRGLLVVLGNGSIQIYDAKGLAREAMPPLGESGLAPSPGTPGSIAVDGAGEIVVVYPDGGLLARYAATGQVTGVRGVALRACERWCADGAGRLYAYDDSGNLRVHDAEGWMTARLSGLGSKCIAVAASPDGRWVAGIDAKRTAVVRINPADAKEPPLVFGQPGKNNGQFEEPTQLAFDGAGRCYVLDIELYRVSVFDDKGAFLFAFGSHGDGASELEEPVLLAVSAAGDAAYVYDADTYEIKKFALDHTAKGAAHITNSGGKGDGAGQYRNVVGLGCDRQGLLYVADDSRGDVQAIDFRGNSAVALTVQKFGHFGIRTVTGLAASPDGQAWLIGGGTVAGARWVDKK